MKTLSLLDQKISSMSDEDLFLEAYEVGDVMKRGFKNKWEKERCKALLKAASEREGLKENRETFLTALRVIKFF
jgi:hypothetical protein